jgi:hypothetical protein
MSPAAVGQGLSSKHETCAVDVEVMAPSAHDDLIFHLVFWVVRMATWVAMSATSAALHTAEGSVKGEGT